MIVENERVITMAGVKQIQTAVTSLRFLRGPFI